MAELAQRPPATGQRRRDRRGEAPAAARAGARPGAGAADRPRRRRGDGLAVAGRRRGGLGDGLPHDPDAALDPRQRAADRACKRRPDAEPVEGALVLPEPAGVAAAHEPGLGRRDRADRGARSRSRRSPTSTAARSASASSARRPKGRKIIGFTTVFTTVVVSGMIVLDEMITPKRTGWGIGNCHQGARRFTSSDLQHRSIRRSS